MAIALVATLASMAWTQEAQAQDIGGDFSRLGDGHGGGDEHADSIGAVASVLGIVVGGGGLTLLVANTVHVGMQKKPKVGVVVAGYTAGTLNVALGGVGLWMAGRKDEDVAASASPEVWRGLGGGFIGLGAATIAMSAWAHSLHFTGQEERAVAVLPITAGPTGHPAAGLAVASSF